jgi:hypothetical protein
MRGISVRGDLGRSLCRVSGRKIEGILHVSGSGADPGGGVGFRHARKKGNTEGNVTGLSKLFCLKCLRLFRNKSNSVLLCRGVKGGNIVNWGRDLDRDDVAY